jgi:hypothetical protein
MKMKWQVIVIDDPWKEIITPSAVAAVNARRVAENGRWDFYWGKAVDGRPLLCLRHSADISLAAKLPKFQGIEAALTARDEDGRRMLLLKLTDVSQKELFYQLCLDIVANADRAISEEAALRESISRTWRWHHLLRGGRTGGLTPEEQKGLIGELLFLEQYLLPQMRPQDALSSWRGPLDGPKDFEVGRVSIEVKARKGSDQRYVRISSETQLDDAGIEFLFLYVIDLDPAPSTFPRAFTLTDVARRVCSAVESADLSAVDQFESLLAAAGFRWEDSYEDYLWIEGMTRHYHVRDKFPRIIPDTTGPAVFRVKYFLNLDACEAFAAEPNILKEALRGDRSGNQH